MNRFGTFSGIWALFVRKKKNLVKVLYVQWSTTVAVGIRLSHQPYKNVFTWYKHVLTVPANIHASELESD